MKDKHFIMEDVNPFNAISIKIASPESIKSWSKGEVKKPRGRRTAQAAAAKPKASQPEEAKSAAGTEVQAARGEALAGGEEAPLPESEAPEAPEDAPDLPL